MFKVVAIGGTFDRLHKGHRVFISEAFEIGEKVIIGITSDTYAREKRKGSIVKCQNLNTRKAQLEKYLKERGFWQRADIVVIHDIYGPLLENEDADVLLVSTDTLKGAREVNKGRQREGKQPLKVVSIPLVPAQDNRRISSTRIREGEIDRWGKVFSRLPVYGRRITEKLRSRLKKPLGELHVYFRPVNIEPVVITVGDAVTKTFLDAGITADISVVDFHIQRKRIYTHLSELGFSPAEQKLAVKVQNPAGFVTKLLVHAIDRAVKQIIKFPKTRIIQVDGEEDLAGLPAILLAPLGSRVYYGQPGEGVVEVVVTEEKKKELVEMIEKNS